MKLLKIKPKWQFICIRAIFFFPKKNKITQDICECIEYRVIIVITTCTYTKKNQWFESHALVIISYWYTVYSIHISFGILYFHIKPESECNVIRFDFSWNARNGLINSFGVFTATPVFRQLKYTTTLSYLQAILAIFRWCQQTMHETKPNWNY